MGLMGPLSLTSTHPKNHFNFLTPLLPHHTSLCSFILFLTFLCERLMLNAPPNDSLFHVAY